MNFDHILKSINPNVIAMLSGGKDSIASVVMLKKAGVPVTAIHFIHKWGSEIPTNEAKRICKQFDIPLIIYDFTKEFSETVIGYQAGRPCLICKKTMYSILLDYLSSQKYGWLCIGDNANDRTTIARIKDYISNNKLNESLKFNTYWESEMGMVLPASISVVRPLIDLSINEVESFLSQEGIKVKRINSTGDKYFEYHREGCPIQFADIGVAMGITGTDVSKGASDMILTDDNFTTIVHAIEEGRNIYNNIKKTIIFLLSCNLGEIICIFLSTLLNWDLPLVATQLLWVNLVTDTLPALALGIDPGDKDVMKRSPRNPKESFFSEGAGVRAVIGGTLIGLLTLVAFYLGISETGMIGNLGQLETMAKAGNEAAKHALTQGRTMAFIVLTVSQLFYSLTMRNSQKTIFEIGIFKNKYLIYSIIIGIALQIGLTSFGPIAQVFKVTKISFENWDIVLLFALIPFAVNEVIKLISRKKSK